MKFNVFLALTAVVALAVSSCKKEEVLGDPSLEISKTKIEFDAQGGTQTIVLKSTLDWALQDYTDEVKSWLVVDPSSGKASNAETTLTLKASANTGINREVSITFFGNVLHKETLVISQKGEKGETETLTVKEFLDRKDTKNVYIVSGKVGIISKSSSYWGFFIKDDTGELCCSFPDNWEVWKDRLTTGGTATIKGKYEYFETKQLHQMANGEITAFTAPASDSIEKVSVAKFLEKADFYTAYRLTGTVASPVSASSCSFDLDDGTAKVKVYTVNNAAEWGTKVKQNGTVTLRGAYAIYNSTPEVVDAWIEVFKEGEGSGKIEGTNLLTNGDFETWESSKPAAWTHASSNATVTQSENVHGGKYSASVAGASGNKRLMSKAYTLKAGTYQIEVFTKGEGQFRLGYAKLTDGVVKDGNNDYVYITEAAAAGSDWTDTYVTFTLKEQTQISVIVMNSKAGGGKAFLLDDVSLVTKDGGLVE